MRAVAFACLNALQLSVYKAKLKRCFELILYDMLRDGTLHE